MNSVSSVQSAGNGMSIAQNRASAGSEEVRESKAEKVKETRQGEEAVKAAKAPPTADAGNNVNLLV